MVFSVVCLSKKQSVSQTEPMSVSALSVYHQNKPFEDDTAVSLIRREGFPPTATVHPAPHSYGCPCCTCLSPRRRREAALQEAADLERRKGAQWDVLESRAKPRRAQSSGGAPNRNTIRRFYATLQQPMIYNTKSLLNPPPPQRVAELRKSFSRGPSTNPSVLMGDASVERYEEEHRMGPCLLITLHYGSHLSTLRTGARKCGGVPQFLIQARYGAVEGSTSTQREEQCEDDNADRCTWEESFELPLQDTDTPIELFVVDNTIQPNEASPAVDYLVGGVMIAPPGLEATEADSWRHYSADHKTIGLSPIGREGESNAFLIVSWEVIRLPAAEERSATQSSAPPEVSTAPNSSTGAEDVCEASSSTLSVAIARVDVYHSLRPHSSVVCLLRRAYDGTCSELITMKRPSHSVHQNALDRFEECDGDERVCSIPAPVDKLRDSTIHLLVCLEDESEVPADDAAALKVAGSVALDPATLQSRGSATFVLRTVRDEEEEAQHNAGAPFGEVTVNWTLGTRAPVSDEGLPAGRQLDFDESFAVLEAAVLDPSQLDHDVLSVVVVRGIDLRQPIVSSKRIKGQPSSKSLRHPSVTVACGSLMAKTPQAMPRHFGSAPCNVVWNQELRFLIPKDCAKDWNGDLCEVIMEEDDEIVSFGEVALFSAHNGGGDIISSAKESGRTAKITEIEGPATCEGFHVVPLYQEGFDGALGHVLLRWKYYRHDAAASRARKQKNQCVDATPSAEAPTTTASVPSAAAVLENPRATLRDESPRIHDRCIEEAVDVENHDTEELPPAESWEARAPSLTAVEVIVDDDEQEDEEVDEAETDAPLKAESPKNSPFGERRISVKNSPFGRKDSVATPSRLAGAMRASRADDGALNADESIAFEFEGGDDDDDIEFDETAADEPEGSTKDQVTSPSKRKSISLPREGLRTQGNPSFSAELLEPHPSFAYPSEQAEPPVTAAEAQRSVPPEPPRLRFCIRRDEYGNAKVAFVDPARHVAATDPSHVDTAAENDVLPAEAHEGAEAKTAEPPLANVTPRGVVPPINCPMPNGTLYGDAPSHWSSCMNIAEAQVDANTRESVARQILREQLEVKFRAGRSSSGSKRSLYNVQPWYPPGESKDESHVPISRRDSERRQLDAIVELELKSLKSKRELEDRSTSRQSRIQQSFSRSSSLGVKSQQPS